MNKLPLAISQILDKLHFSFDERGELPAHNRQVIYREIDKFSTNNNGDTNNFNTGHYLRGKLELICARKVLANWESCELTNGSAKELLDIAEHFLHGQGDMKKLENMSNTFYTQVENLMYKGEEYFIAAYAGFACISAVNTILYDVSFDTRGLPEIELDPDEWTACFYASISYCGGAIWEEGVGDDIKRREFWEWFLYDAVTAL